MKKVGLIVLIVGVLGAAGIWAAVLIAKNQKGDNPFPAYGTSLQSDTGEKIPLDTSSGAANEQSVGLPTGEDMKQYEKHKDSRNILFGEVKAGDGAKAMPGKQVAIAYKGYLTTGQIFDQTTDKALGFTLGQPGIIPGMQMGVAGMKVGGIRRVIIPPSLGYGATKHGSIPANSVLVFDVQLLSVK